MATASSVGRQQYLCNKMAGMMMRVFLTLVLLLAFPSVKAYATDGSDQPMPSYSVGDINIAENGKTAMGYWLTEDGDATIEIYPCGTHACGRFHWLKDNSPGNPSLDDKNPDPRLKMRPLCGLEFIGGLTPQGEGRFVNGWLYSPRHGSTFSANLILKNVNELELRGYAFISLFGGSQTWTRTSAEPTCRSVTMDDPDEASNFHTPVNLFE